MMKRFRKTQHSTKCCHLSQFPTFRFPFDLFFIINFKIEIFKIEIIK